MVRLKVLTVEDIDQALELSGAEKWNQTANDWRFLIDNPENICLAAIDDGRIIGTSVAMNYNNEVVWIGMVLVNKNYRGKGIGKLLLSCLFDKLKCCHSVKLDATPAGQVVYRKFDFHDEYKILRMTNMVDSFENVLLEEQDDLVLITEQYLPDVAAFDEKVFGADRKKLIEFLFKNNRENSWMLKRDGKIVGFALGRKGLNFYQIGPISASSFDDARMLLLKSMEKAKGQVMLIDVLDDKKEMIMWLEMSGFITQRLFSRMYQYENICQGETTNQFFICGPEFG